MQFRSKLSLSVAVLTTVAIISLVFTAGIRTAEAHHSQAAAFHMDRWVEIEGIVQRWLFRNPHPVLYLEVTGENGEPVTWQIEFAPATVLTKRGGTTETF